MINMLFHIYIESELLSFANIYLEIFYHKLGFWKTMGKYEYKHPFKKSSNNNNFRSIWKIFNMMQYFIFYYKSCTV